LTKLIPFVGAGASKLAGCPDWNEFADEALRVFVEHGKFSHAQLDQVKALSPRVKLSIDYIEVFHNQRRRHSTLGQISPAEFERRAAYAA